MKKRIYQSNYPILFPVFLGFIFRLINIQSPIVGVHSWRQADTAAMARHFALQNTPIWLPQIDWSGASKGYVECEFPLFPYLVGQLYKLFGLHEWIGRGLSIFFSVLTIVLVIRIGTRLFDSASGWWGGVFFALLPLNVYYGRTFQAESLLIFFAALSIERFFAWERRSNFLDLFVSWLAFCLACLIKLMPFIWLGLPLIVFQVYSLNKNLKVSIKVLCGRLLKLASSPYLWAYFFGTILIGLIWFRYAYGLGLSTGLSFFLWGRDTDRVSLSMLFDLNVWLRHWFKSIK